jgi:2-polyprenyl-3-methyl-5-hydroxy-6-metoxy-1,4-benzoquinol methylase
MNHASGGYPWDVGDLPFVWTRLSEPSNGGDLADRLPFSLGIDRSCGTLIQLPQQRVREALRIAYRRGSVIGGVMEDGGIHQKYGESFLAFLQEVYGRGDLAGLRVLEIGSGTGYLLRRLRDWGAKVQGIEPGEHGQQAAAHYNLPIVRDFFPSQQLSGTFDLIVLANVLEHVEDPVDLLLDAGKYMRRGSRMAISVPDCEPYIEAGDVSILVHEHWSCYTRQTLANTIFRSVGTGVQIRPASFGGNLYAVAEPDGGPIKVPDDEIRSACDAAARFQAASVKNVQRLQDFFAHAQRQGRTIGVYVPARIVNAATIGQIDLSGCRFFDDNENLHGSYFPGIPIPIESRGALMADPPDDVLIMSCVFGERIRNELQPSVPASTKIVTWSELFA